MARISLDPPRRLPYRIAEWLSRRPFGAVLDPGRAMGHNMPVTFAYGLLESQVLRWRRADRRLKDLGVMASAVAIGCQWCMDFGYWELHTHGIPREKIEAIPSWRTSL